MLQKISNLMNDNFSFDCDRNQKKLYISCFRWNGQIDDFVKSEGNRSFYPAVGTVKSCASLFVSGGFNVGMEVVSCSKVVNPTSSNETYKGVCQYKGCKTKSNKLCKFPFR